MLTCLLVACLFLQWAKITCGVATHHHLLDPDWSTLADTGNYTCDQLVRWLGTEKHYSNEKKEVLFGLAHTLNKNDCKHPVLLLNQVSFGRSKGTNSYFHNPSVTCSKKNSHVVAYLSNFSINNNFSHFLHGLVRLFCALIDARWIEWDNSRQRFVQKVEYTLWLDEYFKLTAQKKQWLSVLAPNIVHLGQDLKTGGCVTAETLIYGSGCVRFLPPEKWFGYPGCRAGEILPAFGQYMRQQFDAPMSKDLFLIDQFDNNVAIQKNKRRHGEASSSNDAEGALKVAFAVRDVGRETGMRSIANLDYTQKLLQRTQHVKTRTENITFEHWDVAATVRYMAAAHVFVSVHGAGMTNMFFMNPGSAVVEIIPYPLCNCRSPDYFYGVGGYYHGSAVAQNIRHYPYCVEAENMVWHKKPDKMAGSKCSWRHLHAVESVSLDSHRFVSLMRSVERDLVQAGTVILTKPIINIHPHANG